MSLSKVNIASWGLLFGAIGLGGLYSRSFPALPGWATMGPLLVP